MVLFHQTRIDARTYHVWRKCFCILYQFGTNWFYKFWFNSMVPGPVNVAFLATFTARFWPIFRFCCLFGNIFWVWNSWKPKCCLFGNIFEQTFPVFAIVCKSLAQEKICTTRFVRRKVFYSKKPFFYHFFFKLFVKLFYFW